MSRNFLLLFSLVCLAGTDCRAGDGEGAWHFESGGVPENLGRPDKLVVPTQAGRSYDLWYSDPQNPEGWAHAAGFPRVGTGKPVEYRFIPDAPRMLFRIDQLLDGAAAAGLAFIPGGRFSMGDDRREGWQVGGVWAEEPVHEVDVSGFFIGRMEVTLALWENLSHWALEHGYTDLIMGWGEADNHPVVTVHWYAAVKWCNARSEKENLTPCYRVDGAVYRTGDRDDVVCDWQANGYRLPTEAEWEKAARGGLDGLRFPWGDQVTHARANYYSEASCPYDTSPTRGFHPRTTNSSSIATLPVGSFAPNNYGLFDMAGNVAEFCWDRMEPGYYAVSPDADPRGPDGDGPDPNRVLRGGGYESRARELRCSNRGFAGARENSSRIGVRVARSRL